MPEEYVAESLLESLSGEDLAGKRVLLPRAAVARDIVPAELRNRGATVDVVEAYRTMLPEGLFDDAREILARKPHWITFTSSSTVQNFIAAAGREALEQVKIASIGPITSATLREHGIEPHAEAAPHTVAGLGGSNQPTSALKSPFSIIQPPKTIGPQATMKKLPFMEAVPAVMSTPSASSPNPFTAASRPALRKAARFSWCAAATIIFALTSARL
jgi:hypothetical protein